MSLWTRTAVLGLYTLTPTHFGTGQTTGAIDLPIARNAATGFPVLPATGIKGVLRHCAEQSEALAGKQVNDLFGPEIGVGRDDGLSAGRLAFSEARLVAYPARSLSRPYFHVTCRQILEGLARDLRATGGDAVLALTGTPDPAPAGALVADPSLDGQPVVLEGLVYPDAEVSHAPAAASIASALAALIPETEQATRRQLQSGLVILPDADFSALMQSAVPVQARVKLTGGKTTDTWDDQEGGSESGNLWYEEYLPSDCLFVALMGERRLRSTGANGARNDAGLGTLVAARDAFAVIQIGGNETVGQGLTLCTILSDSEREASS